MKSLTGRTSGPPRTPLPSFSSLARQPSIYTLTLEELQNAVKEPGKNFGSMNMEEFMRNVWTAEESQAMAAAMSGAVEGNVSSSTGSAPTPAGLQRGLSVPRNLTGKTVDEVWKEIHRSDDGSTAGNTAERHVTLADVTLEDFLAKASAMRDGLDVEPSANSSSSALTLNVNGPAADVMQASHVAPSHQMDWLNFQLKGGMPHQQLLHHQHLLQQHQQQQQQQADAAAATFLGRLAVPSAMVIPPVTAANVVDVSFDPTTGVGPPKYPHQGAAPGNMDASYDSATGASLSLSPVLGVSDRKRPYDGCEEEKSAGQRQKRMIKNRESAARSRARKQAYNVELEAEVEKLKEENDKLLQQQIERTKKRRRELMETLIPVTSQPQRPKRLLRRTQTTFW